MNAKKISVILSGLVAVAVCIASYSFAVTITHGDNWGQIFTLEF